MTARVAGMIAAGWGERLNQRIPKALTPVAGRALIDFSLDGLQAAGVGHLTCIVNEAAREVTTYVENQRRDMTFDWIVQTTPSSMHSFLIVLERLARLGETPYLMATVDSVCPPSVYAEFARRCDLFPFADVCLGLTNVIDDENPLRVAMSGSSGTGLLPDRMEDDPEAYAIVAMTNNGFDSEFVTSGFYRAHPRILKEKDAARRADYKALRQYLGHLLKHGYRFYGVPLPPVIDVDRTQDVRAAEQLVAGQASS